MTSILSGATPLMVDVRQTEGGPNTDRTSIHRLAQLALAVTFLLTAKLIDWRNRWSPALPPIR